MRVIARTRNVQSVAYRSLWALGVVSGLFTFLVSAFMIANNLQLRAVDPMHTPALQRLLREMRASPQNDALKDQIRELDHLARRAFFASQHFNKIGVWLLLGGATVTLISFKTLSDYHREMPHPDPRDPKDDLAANALWARQSVAVAGLILVGLALSLALPWESPLDQHASEVSHTSSDARSKVTTSNWVTSSSEATTPADREERLKHWPSFRGPASGHVAATNLPMMWDGISGRGILWKTKIPLQGFGSPIVWGHRVFVSGGNEHTRAVYSLDAMNGAVLWDKTLSPMPVSPGKKLEVNTDTGYAAPTMTTDGARVFALFATGELVAFDFDGKQIWSQQLGIPVNPYGHSSSLEIFENTLLVQFDHKQDGFVAGFDVGTGAVRWKKTRTFGPSWASPVLIETGERTELVLVADAFVTSYDPRTGHELWQLECLESADVAPTPVFANGFLFVAADQVKFVCIDVQSRKVVWENKNITPGIGTPVAAGDFLFAGLGDGGISCWDARNGKRLWEHETDDGFYASPLIAGDRIFLIDRQGKMFIFEASGTAFRSISQPLLGEESVTTPAVYGESLICRGVHHVMRIGL